MVTVAEWLLRTGWQAAVLAVMVLLAQRVFGPWILPKWRYRLWGLVVLRLMLPVPPASPLSLFNLDPVSAAGLFSEMPPRHRPVPAGGPAPLPSPSAGSEIRDAGAAGPRVIVTTLPPRWPTGPAGRTPTAPVTAPADATSDAAYLFVLVWVTGAAFLFLRLAWGHLAFTRRLRGAAPLDDAEAQALVARCAREAGVRRPPRVLVTDAVHGPAVCGLLRPTLLLPPGLTWRLEPDELRMVFLHELAHLRCRDVPAHWLLEALQVLHWFNPVLWVAFARCRADREMARDEMVLRLMTRPETGEGSTATEPAERYGQVLLKLVQQAVFAPRMYHAVGMVGVLDHPSSLDLLPRRGRLTQRIQMIATFTRSARSASRFPLVALLLVLGIGCTGLTGAKKQSAPGPDQPRAGGTAPAQAGEAKYTVTHVYDIRELLVHFPDASDPPQLGAKKGRRTPTASSVRATTRPEPAPRATGKPGEPREGPGTSLPDEAAPTRDLVHEIIHLLIETVDPPSWREAGGNLGSVREASGQLVVTQTPENQRQVARILDQLRETRAVQLMVEAHLLTVDPKMWKKLGVDWPPAPPADAAGAAPGGAARGSTGLILSKEQVDQLLRAAQEQGGSRILSAPRLTLFNGQRAYVLIGNEHPYVSGYRPVKGRDGGRTFEPEMEFATAGMAVDVTATASRDRKSVTLTLRPQLGAVVGMTEVPWPGRPDDSTLTVQDPQMRLSEIRTTVAVPDGGTLLLGGLEDVDGALGDIGPDTRPAATQPAAPGQARMVYMLVKPKIIVQREVEQKQF